ncbi:MAG: S9 family peptidase [Candidatus Hodarchaeales archaeon]|jgi:dipeptidyl aminopeptidase/acylaminoacyl peptidase
MDLFERIKLILETQGYFPFDVSNVEKMFTGNFLAPSNALLLHLTYLDEPNDHIQILPDDSFTIDAKFSPDDSWIALPVDYSGKEDAAIYRLSTTSTERPIPLERVSKSTGRHLWLDWSPDGKKIVRGYSQRGKNKITIFDNNLDSDETVLWEGEAILQSGSWKHANLLKFTNLVSKSNEYSVTVMDVNTKEILVTIPVANSFTFFGTWHPSNHVFPYLTKEDSKLAIFNVDTGEKIILPTPEGEVERVEWNVKGDTLLLSVTKNARDKIFSIQVDSKELIELPVPQGINKLIKVRKVNNEEIMFFIHADGTTRMNLWMYNLETGTYEQLTKKRSSKIGTKDFSLVQSISERWQSTDGLEIHGFVMVPSSPPPEDGYPAVVYVHGGPMGQDVDSFVGTYQVLTQEGFVVFRPNFRGSTGYGEAFQRANFREIGKADLLDITTGVEMLIEKYDVNPKKIIITGGSYGGYMTLRAMTKPEIFEFCAGWAEAAISDWEYMYDEAVDELFKQFVVFLFGSMENNESRQFLIESSPIKDWEKVNKPLGVVQFANDTRTPLKPVLDFVSKLYERGDDVEFHVRPAMGHANIPKGYLVRSIARSIQYFQRVIE